MATCYRHPDRETGVSCSRCGNPICPDCMRPSPVGMHCPDCAKQPSGVRRPRAVAVAVPVVTYALIAINVAFFLAQVMTGDGGGARAESGEVYINLVLFGPFVEAGDWWRLLSSGFLHADPMHLLLNMVGLYFLGNLVEPGVGHVRFAAIYFAALFAGSFGALLLSPDAATVGASGAIFGLMGAAFVLLRERGIDPMQTFLGPLIIINVVFTFAFAGSISVGGHLGGFAGGLLAAYAITMGERRRSLLVGLAGCLVVAVISVAGGIAVAGS